MCFRLSVWLNGHRESQKYEFERGIGTEAELCKAFWAFSGIASSDCRRFKKQSTFFGVARSTYVGSQFRNTSRVGGGVEIKKTAIFVLIRAEMGPTEMPVARTGMLYVSK